MGLLHLLRVMYILKLLTPIGFYRLITAIYRNGLNLSALLHISANSCGDKIALVDDDEILTYKELLRGCEKLAMALKGKYQIKKGDNVALLCKNHSSMVKAIFALSRLGADIYLLNAEIGSKQLSKLLNRYDFKYLMYDQELSSLLSRTHYNGEKILSYHSNLPAISNLVDKEMNNNIKIKVQRSYRGKLVLLTGGTTGEFKTAAHKPSLFNFLNPLLTLLMKLNLTKYNTAYIATPIYHGYGIALLCVFTMLGKKIIITRDFNAEKACRLVRVHQVEVVSVVPLMINRMLREAQNDLASLRCIASGGAFLNPKLVEEIFNKLGDIVYNLYGTSEAGLNLIATPQDLRYSPKTIGKEVMGTRLKILDGRKKEVEKGAIGQIYISNIWSMGNKEDPWIAVGDLAFQDSNGYYFLCGRADDMIVSAGENVYPVEIEQVLVHHPLVEDVVVMGVRDENFGQRLKAYVQLIEGVSITVEEIFEWLKPQIARYQTPKEIVIVKNLPYTPLGKHDKKQLN